MAKRRKGDPPQEQHRHAPARAAKPFCAPSGVASANGFRFFLYGLRATPGDSAIRFFPKRLRSGAPANALRFFLKRARGEALGSALRFFPYGALSEFSVAASPDPVWGPLRNFPKLVRGAPYGFSAGIFCSAFAALPSGPPSAASMKRLRQAPGGGAIRGASEAASRPSRRGVRTEISVCPTENSLWDRFRNFPNELPGCCEKSALRDHGEAASLAARIERIPGGFRSTLAGPPERTFQDFSVARSLDSLCPTGRIFPERVRDHRGVEACHAAQEISEAAPQGSLSGRFRKSPKPLSGRLDRGSTGFFRIGFVSLPERGAPAAIRNLAERLRKTLDASASDRKSEGASRWSRNGSMTEFSVAASLEVRDRRATKSEAKKGQHGEKGQALGSACAAP